VFSVFAIALHTRSFPQSTMSDCAIESKKGSIWIGVWEMELMSRRPRPRLMADLNKSSFVIANAATDAAATATCEELKTYATPPVVRVRAGIAGKVAPDKAIPARRKMATLNAFMVDIEGFCGLRKIGLYRTLVN